LTEWDEFDRHLADRLRATAQQPGSGLVERLHDATDRGRRLRRRRRRLAVAAVAAVAVAVPVAAVATVSTLHGADQRQPLPADGTRLLGAFFTNVPPQDSPSAAAAGRWTMTLRSDGTVGLTGPVGYRGVLSGSSYQVAGSTVRINLFVQDRCAATPVGQYQWTEDGAGLHFTVVSDACQFRRLVMTAGQWQPGT
jgi:hypothetical protein